MPSNYYYTVGLSTFTFDERFVSADLFLSGNLYSWGSDINGELGINANVTRRTPITTILSVKEWKTVDSGDTASVAIGVDGTLWTWGDNFNGTLGINSNIGSRSTPVTTFAGGNNWKHVSCGNGFIAAIKTDGSLWTWGQNLYGKLGINVAGGVRVTPVTTFAGGNNWKQVSCGNDHVAAIKNDGTLWTWGFGLNGELGTNSFNGSYTPITTFAGGNNWDQCACFLGTSAIKRDGSLWSWGPNTYGECGTNDSMNRSTPVTTFSGGNNWRQIVRGKWHVAAIKNDGSLWVWGAGGNGALGTADNNIARSTPVTTFAGGNNWKQVSCHQQRTMAIKSDGTLWGWGYNASSARLGVNDLIDRLTPVTTFAGGNNWKHVSCGSEFTIAIQYSEYEII